MAAFPWFFSTRQLYLWEKYYFICKSKKIIGTSENRGRILSELENKFRKL